MWVMFLTGIFTVNLVIEKADNHFNLNIYKMIFGIREILKFVDYS